MASSFTKPQPRVFPQPAQNQHLKPTPFPFITSPSRLALHQPPARSGCSFTSPSNNFDTTPTSPTKPLTTLLLSLPLAQKIQALILLSRQIEALARGWFAGSAELPDVDGRMSVLEERYDGLREEVEGELECAWVNAGFVPADVCVPKFPASGKAPGTHSARPIVPNTGISTAMPSFNVVANLKSTIGKECKRKQPDFPFPSLSTANKRPKAVPAPAPIQTFYDPSSLSDSGEVYVQPASPTGLRTCMMPLKPWEMNAMRGFDWWIYARGKVGERSRRELGEGCVSPRGGVYPGW
ncbi:hypothetical protein K458DRAFT_465669 [Lentithecium fluviatile CBS 122367]|uniref:Uncharacterized protein n=1 Tax=Lentithecium fluviatile CBS 122367 TaxID=1168545 RepID=A0A6G1JEY5_9PLEO|nr:hypothetical protein K458DRAFT_465669 [Lentithecium fluviatile CBS 122367]